MNCGRCFKALDSTSDAPPQLIAIDEEANRQTIHRCRFGKVDRMAYEPGPQIDVLKNGIGVNFIASRSLLFSIKVWKSTTI
jgi:hypothetical protein